MILYFSGTGNSRYGAQLLAEQLGDELKEINQFMKRGEYPCFSSEKPYIFVTPVYAWRIPRVVEDFISRCSFEGKKEAYFVITCGDSIGNAAHYVQKFCQEIGLRYLGATDIIMPENFITMFHAPSPAECERQLTAAEKKLEKVGRMIGEKERLMPEGKPMKFLSSAVNPLFYSFCISSKKFYAKENCNGCGLCQKVCPLNVISLKDKVPSWGKGCTQCMACISSCPVEAIEYGKKTEGKPRYRCEWYRS